MKKDKPRRSLSKKTFIAMLLLSAFIGVVILVAGFALYYLSVLDEYRVANSNYAKSVTMVLDKKEVHTEASKILEIYESIPDEERGDGSDEEYLSKFSSCINQHFYSIQADMNLAKRTVGLRNCFIVAIDEKKSRFIYLVDSDPHPETICLPGSIEQYKPDEISVLLYGDKNKHFTKNPDEAVDVHAVITNLPAYGFRCTGGAPLFKYKDYTIMVCLDEKLDQLITASKIFMGQYILLLLGVMLIAACVGVALVRKITVKPLLSLANAARGYTEDKVNGLRSTVRFKSLDLNTGDEIEELSRTMAEMEDSLTEYENDLTKAATERERIRTELDLATKIQANMLPNVFPAFPERSDFDIYASMTPAKEVGGDFYDFVLVDEDHLAFLIGDVSGKGIPAALFMTAVKIILDDKILEGYSPDTVLKTTNDMVCMGEHEEMFVTVWLGILELSTGKLTAANAGHEKPVLISPDGKAERIKDRHGFIIGGMEGMKYSSYELQLTPGSKIFIYTDGVPEATKEDDEQFGIGRMLQALEAGAAGAPQQVLDSVRDAVDEFVGEAEPFDDLTMLCLEYKGRTP